jgi:HEPN domain-containing protein
MNSRDAASDLLALAREDLSSARALYAAEGISERSVGFHAQQAVEKALKAVLAVQGAEFPFTHDIAVLIELCEDAGFEIPQSLADADHLTPYAAALRYGLGDPNAVEPESAIAWAALAVEWAEGIGKTDLEDPA